MSGIFISYRREDAQELATALHNRLEQRFGDEDVFFDTEDLSLGIDFLERIQATLDETDIVLAVIGPHWVDAADEHGNARLRKSDDFVRLEILAAAKRGIPIIPIFVGGATGLEPDKLPEELRFLALRHGQEIKPDRMNPDMDSLMNAVAPMIGKAASWPAKPEETGAADHETAVTFLFTDIQDSSAKWEQHLEGMRQALARHDEVLRSTMEANGGEVFAVSGDGMSVAFDSPIAAVRAAIEAQRHLEEQSWEEVAGLEVRMALNTGAPQRRQGNYFGPSLNRTARLLELANGGQIVVANATYELVHDRLPIGATLEDRGTHHLRSLQRSEHVFQLIHVHLAPNETPLRTGAVPATPLPVVGDTFIGRGDELAHLLELLETSRVVTLTGVGGTGKTRLSLELARMSADRFPDGVHLASLEPIDEEPLVIKVIADALGVDERPGESMIDLVVNALRERKLLLAIDNCEHVIGACAAAATAIHDSCPGVTILATSREPLGVAGEVNYRVPGLAVPATHDMPVGELAGIESVALFIDRASKADRSFRLNADNAQDIAKLCDYVDGIPLAIELAAVRAGALSPAEIQEEVQHHLRVLASRSRTVQPRHRTLEAAIAWSYRLLTPEQKRVFVRLSPLRGGFTMNAAMAIAGDADPATDVFDDVLELVAKSLVLPGEGADGRARYRMLTTLRQFGHDKLEADGEWDLYSERHARYYLGLAEEMAADLQGADQQHARDQLEMERDNLAAAVDWAVGAGQRDIAGRLAVALRWFWYWGGHILEGHLKMGRVLEMLLDERDVLLGTVAMGAGILADVKGDLEAATDHLELALAVAEELGDRTLAARTQAALGVVAKDHGALAEAADRFKQSMALNREVGHDVDYEITLRFAGEISYLRGDYATAAELLTKAHDLAESIGRAGEVAWSSSHIGELYRRQGSTAEARSTLKHAAELHRSIDYPRGVAWTEMFLGTVEAGAGESDRAEETLRRSLATFEQVADQRGRPYALAGLAALAHERGDLHESAQLAQQAREAAATIGDDRAVAWGDLQAAATAWAERSADFGDLRSALTGFRAIEDSAGRYGALQLAAEIVDEGGDHDQAEVFRVAAGGVPGAPADAAGGDSGGHGSQPLDVADALSLAESTLQDAGADAS